MTHRTEAAALFASCLTCTLVFRAGPFLAMLSGFILWPLLPERLITSDLGAWASSAIPVVLIAAFLTALTLVVTVGLSHRENGETWPRVRQLWTSRALAGSDLTVGDVIALVFVLQMLPLLAAASGTALAARIALFIVEAAFFIALLVRWKLFVGDISYQTWVGKRGFACGVMLTVGVMVGIASAMLSLTYSKESPSSFVDAYPYLQLVETLIFAPIVFELVYRAGLQRSLVSGVGNPVGIVLASVCFVLYHEDMQFVHYVDLFAFSVLAGLAYAATGSLIAPVVAHAIGNLGSTLEQGVRTFFLGHPSATLPAEFGYGAVLLVGVVLCWLLTFVASGREHALWWPFSDG